MKRQIVKVLQKPATKKLIKSLGEEAVNTGSELLLGKINGNKSFQDTLDKRIQSAKETISNAVGDARKNARKIKKSGQAYQRFVNSDTDFNSDVEEDEVYYKKVPRYTKMKMRGREVYRNIPKKVKPRRVGMKKQRKSRKLDNIYQTVFD